jgi:hypothetical protein
MTDNPMLPLVVKFIRAHDYRVIFANHSRMRITPGAEFSIIIGFLDQVPGENATVEESAAIVLSPQHAKLLARGLTEGVKQFEERHGEILFTETQPEEAARVSAILQAAIKPPPPKSG